MAGHFGSWLISIGFINRHALHFRQLYIHLSLLNYWANDTQNKSNDHFSLSIARTKYVKYTVRVLTMCRLQFRHFLYAKCPFNDRMKNYWDKIENIVVQSYIMKHSKLNSPVIGIVNNGEINENGWNAFFSLPFLQK